MSCRDTILGALRELVVNDANAVTADNPYGKELKFDDKKITEELLLNVFDGTIVDEAAIDAIAKLMGPLSTKVNGARDMNLDTIRTYVDAVNDPEKIVPYNIALKELFDTQKAEYDKMLKTTGIDNIDKISDYGIMNVGLARSASVIGRKYAYTLGYRFKSNPEQDGNAILSPKNIESIYNKIGRKVLQDMANDGLVELVDNTDVINDYWTNTDIKKRNRKAPLTIKTSVARPILENIVGKDNYEKYGEEYKKLLRGENKSSESTVMSDIRTMVTLVDNAKIPPLTSKPRGSAASLEEQAENDSLTVSPTTEKARALLHENPVFVNDKVIPFLRYMSDQWKNSNQSFEAFVKGLSKNEKTMLNVFGIHPSNKFSSEIEDSVIGQNKSKLNPLEDLLNQLDYFVDDKKALEMYMNYNYVRNGRFNMDQSVANAQGSPFIRHLVGSGSNTVDLTNPDNNHEEARHFIDAILDQADSININWGIDSKLDRAGKSEFLYDTIIGALPNTELEAQLKLYKGMLGKNGKWQYGAVTNFKANGNMMATIDTLGAIHDLREGLESGIVTTNFNSKSDATASGGSISSSASVGYGDDALSVIEQLGFIEGKEGSVDDIYSLLSNKLLNLINPNTSTNEEAAPIEAADLERVEGLKSFLDVVYEGKMRDLSKDPTMTFVYNQGPKGAIQTIAQTVTERLIKNLHKPKVQDYVADLLKLDHKPTYDELFNMPDVKKNLINALIKEGTIKFIHEQLQEAVNPIIKKRKEVILSLYNALASKVSNISIPTAMARIDANKDPKFKLKRKHYMPLMKKQNVLHQDTVSDIITIEEKLNETTALVNTTHGQDNAIASIAITRAVAEFKRLYPGEKIPGMSFVHDEIITATKLGVLVDKHYLDAFAEVVSEYSVEQELLIQLKEVDPNNPLIAELEPVINSAIASKKAAMKEFTKETGKVYGTYRGTYKIKVGTKPKPTPPKGPNGGKPKAKPETIKDKWVEDPNDPIPFQLVEGTPNIAVDRQLHKKLESKLKKLYPEITLKYTTKDIRRQGPTTLNQEEYTSTINYRMKLIDALIDISSPKPSKHGGTDQAKLVTLRASSKTRLKKLLLGKGIDASQIDVVFDVLRESNRKEMKIDDIVPIIMSKFTTSIELVTTAHTNVVKRVSNIDGENVHQEIFKYSGDSYIFQYTIDKDNYIADEAYYTYKDGNTTVIEEKSYYNARNKRKDVNSNYYEDLTVPGGTDYAEVELRTPSAFAAITGHANFSTKEGIGWYRLDSSTEKSETLRILEMQSDLFQKTKGNKRLDIVKTNYTLETSPEISSAIAEKDRIYDEWDAAIDNNLPTEDSLQLEYRKALKNVEALQVKQYGSKYRNDYNLSPHEVLRKKDKWVTFMVESIIQDSIAEGDIKYLQFPTADTIFKIEQYTKSDNSPGVLDFYGNKLSKLLNELYPGKVKKVMDSHGNTWNEVYIESIGNSTILLQKNNGRIKGQADLKAKTVLIDERIMTQDTLPHEYAHHYIAMFRDAPIVQEAIKKWGSEEKLVQAIGEQVVTQKGEVYGWWKKFTEWVKGHWKGLSAKDKTELKNLLTDAFLENKDLGTKRKFTIDEVYNQLADEIPEGFDPSKNYTTRDITRPEIVFGRSVNMLNQVTRNLLIQNAERIGTGALSSLDKFLIRADFPMYREARARILSLYEDSAISPALQELAHYVKATSFKGKELKQKVLSLSHNIKEERNAREHKYLSEIQRLTKQFDEEGKEKLYDLVTRVPIHNYFRQDDKFTDKKSIDAEVSRLQKKLTDTHNDIVEDTVAMLIDDKVRKNSIYNLSERFSYESKLYDDVETLIALRTMQETNTISDIENLRKHEPELYTIMKDNSLTLYSLSMKLHDMSPKGASSTHTLVKEPFKHKQIFKAITVEDRKLYDSGELMGWKIIKEPTDKTPGVVTKKIIDDTFTEGASIINDLPDHDVHVPKHIAEAYDLTDSNILKAGNKYKMILTREEKKAAGLVEDMGTALVKSTANIMSVDDAAYIRNKLLEPSVRSVITNNSDEEINDVVLRIKDDIVDHPWFLKLEDGVKFDQLPQEIKAKYKPIQQNLSSVGNFKDEVTHVRKDIRHWLVGGHSPSLFKNPKLQRISQITKELVAGAKIGMGMLNPKKLAMDSVSNNLQLSMLGVPASKIAGYSEDILKSIDSFNKIKNAMFEAKVKYSADPTTENETRYKKLQDRLKRNDLYTAYSNGFMSSLSSDILNSNVDTTEGLQADIHKVLKYMLTDREGNKNILHEVIGNASRFGMDGTQILTGIGKIASNFNEGREIERYLDGVAKNIQEIKRDDDMVNYLGQFTVSPNAETVKAGTWLNDVMDMMMRETYRRHLIDVGVSPEKAIEKAIAMSPDYKEDMPIGVKVLSDYFVIPFPSFMLRMLQPTLYVARNKPINAFIESELIGLDDTFFGAHPFKRVFENQFISSPASVIGVNSVAPTNLFNF